MLSFSGNDLDKGLGMLLAPLLVAAVCRCCFAVNRKVFVESDGLGVPFLEETCKNIDIEEDDFCGHGELVTFHKGYWATVSLDAGSFSSVCGFIHINSPLRACFLRVGSCLSVRDTTMV